MEASTMEASMKRTLLGITAAAFVLASPSFAQTTSTGTTSAPGIGVSKADQTVQKKKSKKHATSQAKRKHTASNTKRHTAKSMKSKAQTTGSGSSSAPGMGVNKDET